MPVDIKAVLASYPGYEVKDITETIRTVSDYSHYLELSTRTLGVIYLINKVPSNAGIWAKIEEIKDEQTETILVHGFIVMKVPKASEKLNRILMEFLTAPSKFECGICTETSANALLCDLCWGRACKTCFDRLDTCPYCRKSFVTYSSPRCR